MDSATFDVLTFILQRLPLQQLFNLLSEQSFRNKKFLAAIIDALKKRVVLVSIKNELTTKTSCFVNQHDSKGKQDWVPWKLIKKSKTRKRILSLLPGLKFAYLNVPVQGLMKDLSGYCKKIECLKFEMVDRTFSTYKLPSLLHYEGFINNRAINRLQHLFPSLICIRSEFTDLYDKSSLREGLKTLTVDFHFGNLSVICSSPAMKTIEELTIGVYFFDENFTLIAPKLKKLDLQFNVYNESFPTLCSSVEKLLSHALNLSSLDWWYFHFLFQPTPQEMPKSLFRKTSQLLSLSLRFTILNLDEILQVISSMNPYLKQLQVQGVTESSKKKGVLDIISTSIPRLECLVIDNTNHSNGITHHELIEFVQRNTVNGKLRFRFTLKQKFPETLS